MKKTVFALLFFLIFLIAAAPLANAVLYEPNTDDVEVLYMESLDDGTVIASKNADMRVSPASVTKIVTAIITIENCPDLEKVIKAPSSAIRALDGTNSSTADIKSGEKMSIRNYLQCLLVQSANDAANVLAHYVGNGKISAFVDLMNQFVSNLGCTGTHFVNPHGLDDPDHYTTALDLAKIAKYCLKNDTFCEIAETFSCEIPATNQSEARELKSTNGLLNDGIPDYYYQYCRGGKTGTTDDAGRCLLSWATMDGYNYLCVAMNGKFYDYDDDGVEENMAFIESKNLYRWVFAHIRLREVANPEVYIGEVEVLHARKTDHVQLAAAGSVSALVPVDVGTESVVIKPYRYVEDYTPPEELDEEALKAKLALSYLETDDPAKNTVEQIAAPVKKGEVLGRGAILYANQVIAEVDLVAAADVKASFFKTVGSLILQTLGSKTFLILLGVILLVILPGMIVLFIVMPLRRAKLRRRMRTVRVDSDLQTRAGAARTGSARTPNRAAPGSSVTRRQPRTVTTNRRPPQRGGSRSAPRGTARGSSRGASAGQTRRTPPRTPPRGE